MIALLPPPEPDRCPVCGGRVVPPYVGGTGDCMCVVVVYPAAITGDMLTVTINLDPEPKGDEPWRKHNRHRFDFAR